MIGPRASNEALLADALSRHLTRVRPLGDGEPWQLTRFTDGPRDILNRAISPDGKQLAVARGRVRDDVYLLRDFR